MIRGRANGSSRKRLVTTVLVLVIVGAFFYFHSQSSSSGSSAVEFGKRHFGWGEEKDDVELESSTITGEDSAVVPKSFPVSC